MKPCIDRFILAGGALALLLSAGFAVAAEPTPWYAGGGIGLDDGRVDCLSGFKCDHTDKFFRVFGGYRLDDHVELQADWFQAGHFNGADTTPLGTKFNGEFGVTGFAFTGGYRYRFAPAWSVVGRAGVSVMRANFDYANPAYGGDKSKTTAQPYGSASLSYDVAPNVTVNLDYDLTRFKAHHDNGVLQLFGVSAQYAF